MPGGPRIPWVPSQPYPHLRVPSWLPASQSPADLRKCRSSGASARSRPAAPLMIPGEPKRKRNTTAGLPPTPFKSNPGRPVPSPPTLRARHSGGAAKVVHAAIGRGEQVDLTFSWQERSCCGDGGEPRRTDTGSKRSLEGQRWVSHPCYGIKGTHPCHHRALLSRSLPHHAVPR